MTLDNAIDYFKNQVKICEWKANNRTKHSFLSFGASPQPLMKLASDYEQLVFWLEEYKQLKKQKEANEK